MIAKNIVAYREERTADFNQKRTVKVPKLGPKAYEQCAGFMRITGGKQPLDATSVHPESYEAAKELLKKLGCQEEDIAGGNLKGLSKKIKDKAALADELGIGVMTLEDIVKS